MCQCTTHPPAQGRRRTFAQKPSNSTRRIGDKSSTTKRGQTGSWTENATIGGKNPPRRAVFVEGPPARIDMAIYRSISKGLHISRLSSSWWNTRCGGEAGSQTGKQGRSPHNKPSSSALSSSLFPSLPSPLPVPGVSHLRPSVSPGRRCANFASSAWG